MGLLVLGLCFLVGLLVLGLCLVAQKILNSEVELAFCLVGEKCGNCRNL